MYAAYFLEERVMANLLDVMTSAEKERYSQLLMKVDTDINIEKVILSEENQEKVKQIKLEMDNAYKLRSYGLFPMNRLLFYGESGCGKTFLAKALSNYLDYYMLYVDIAKALSDGTVSKSISDIFAIANKYGKCVIFFDECDSIAWNRDAVNGEGGVARRATNSIFQSLDQMNPDNVFIAATNMLHRLDAAFENRFNLKLEFRLPELDIQEILKKFVKPQFKIIDDINADGDIDETGKGIIDKRCKLSYRELQSIVDREMKKAVINDTLEIKVSDVYEAVATQQHIRIKFKIAEGAE